MALIPRFPGLSGVMCALLALASVIATTGCGQADKREAPTAIPADVALKLVLLGTGETCENDRSCGRPPSAGVCLLGTCYGLLTTDAPAAREVLGERLGASSPQMRRMSEDALLRAVRHPETRSRTMVSGVVGLGYLMGARNHAECGKTCEVVRKLTTSADDQVATVARHALSRRRDETVIDDLVLDLQQGTPHLACAAARALGRYDEGDLKLVARAALSAAIKTDNAAVRAAVGRALKL